MEYRVVWTRIPTDYHQPMVIFVKAGSIQDAKDRAVDQIERQHGITRFRIIGVKLAPSFEEIQ